MATYADPERWRIEGADTYIVSCRLCARDADTGKLRFRAAQRWCERNGWEACGEHYYLCPVCCGTALEVDDDE
jgi:hypothetical protein